MNIKKLILVSALALVATASTKADEYNAQLEAQIARQTRILEDMEFRQRQQQEAIEFQESQQKRRQYQRDQLDFLEMILRNY